MRFVASAMRRSRWWSIPFSRVRIRSSIGNMWQERFNLGIESIEQRLGSFETNQEQGGLLLAFLFSRRERNGWHSCCGAYSSAENYALSIILVSTTCL